MRVSRQVMYYQAIEHSLLPITPTHSNYDSIWGIMLTELLKGEYFNLASLWVREPIKQKPTLLTLDYQRQTVAQSKTQYKKIYIERWKIHLLYTSAYIYIMVHPDKTLLLVKHMHEVIMGSNGWIPYDEQFRLRMLINRCQS